MKKLIKTFIETLMVAVVAILIMWYIGYVPPNPRIFNMVDKITLTSFFDNRIYDNWLMLAFIFAFGTTVFDAISIKNKEN
ncbi:hypothetical protein RN70_05010 [Staphylococcus schleiferi]|nr:hypothetical protein LH95_04810 [Staphylococcus schleiferi]MBA8763031.1 hypothetical protein [Staphylococcus coagulans]AKS70240.1 hypothetical protein NP71_04815 [Staphylococcus schleiferi]AKS72360.1 hypothetical protein OA96_04700 [Staphylococcus schleiferi]AKS74650.1 hypothetical protein RN70_05010 [Staphylococcus schleiferi]